jgi:DNA-binding NarL/FixJ family response regulator
VRIIFMNRTLTKKNETAGADLMLLKSELDSLSMQVEQLNGDIQYIKSFFVAVDERKEQRRLQKEQERLGQERRAKAHAERKKYEALLWNLRQYPWNIWPTPKSGLSRKEEELVSLMARGESDEEICKKMNLVASSIIARLCVIRKALKANSREAVIAFYLNYQADCREHRQRRCLYVLSWLLNPPPGENCRPAKWETLNANLGLGREFRLIGPRVPMRLFKDLRPYEQAALKMKLEGLAYSEISERLKVKPATVKGYIVELRSVANYRTGAAVNSDEDLLDLYKRYLKIVERREAAKALAASGRGRPSSRDGIKKKPSSGRTLYKRPAQNYPGTKSCYPFWKT